MRFRRTEAAAKTKAKSKAQFGLKPNRAFAVWGKDAAFRTSKNKNNDAQTSAKLWRVAKKLLGEEKKQVEIACTNKSWLNDYPRRRRDENSRQKAKEKRSRLKP